MKQLVRKLITLRESVSNVAKAKKVVEEWAPLSDRKNIGGQPTADQLMDLAELGHSVDLLLADKFLVQTMGPSYSLGAVRVAPNTGSKPVRAKKPNERGVIETLISEEVARSIGEAQRKAEMEPESVLVYVNGLYAGQGFPVTLRADVSSFVSTLSGTLILFEVMNPPAPPKVLTMADLRAKSRLITNWKPYTDADAPGVPIHQSKVNVILDLANQIDVALDPEGHVPPGWAVTGAVKDYFFSYMSLAQGQAESERVDTYVMVRFALKTVGLRSRPSLIASTAERKEEPGVSYMTLFIAKPPKVVAPPKLTPAQIQPTFIRGRPPARRQ